MKHSDGVFRITEVLDFNSVVATSVESGRPKVLLIAELAPPEAQQPTAPALSDVDIDAIAENDWRVAQTRYAAIEPLLNGQCSRQAVEQRAQELTIDPATLYRWLSRYRSVDAISALIPMRRGWTQGKRRLGERTDAVITEVIQNFYLKPERPCAQKVVREVHRICDARSIERPSATAVRARIAAVPEYERLKRRGQVERAKNKFMATPGKFPGADYPLAVVQIDHTRVDIILVDDLHRKPIDRPWVTVAIDVYSRMTVGYYLSFDAPSLTSVAMCLAHAVLPKEEWLLLHNVEGTWPVWGRPHTIHVDNGPDFRSNGFRESCEMYGINLEFRPVKRPRFGGHVERLQGTLLREIHDIPGSTFSSIKDRDQYDSEGRAVMTKDEFERQLLTLICNEYHRRPHSAIGMPPLRRWEQGIFGGPDGSGAGVPPRPTDRLTVLLDFLPSFQRTIQNDGVTVEGLRYYADALRPWIGAKDPGTSSARIHTFRRDPRDVSSVWFFDPDLKQYFKVPLADQSIASFSVWEHRQAKAALQKAGHNPSDERAVFKSIADRREMVDASAERTKRARREAQRRVEHAKATNPAIPNAKPVQTPPSAVDKSVEPVLSTLSTVPGLLAFVEPTDDIA